MASKQSASVLAKMHSWRESANAEMLSVLEAFLGMQPAKQGIALAGRLLTFLDVQAATSAIKLWRGLLASGGSEDLAPTAWQLNELRIELVEMLGETDMMKFMSEMLESRGMLKPMLKYQLEIKALHQLLPQLLPLVDQAVEQSFLGSALAYFGSHFQDGRDVAEGSPAHVAAGFDEQGAQAVASLYLSLQQPAMRVACLTHLTNKDVFGNEELEHLLQYMRVVCPLSLRRYVNAMQALLRSFTATPPTSSAHSTPTNP